MKLEVGSYNSLGVSLWRRIVAPFKFHLLLFNAQDRTLGNSIASNISLHKKVKLVLLLCTPSSPRPPSWLASRVSTTSCSAVIYNNRQLFPNQNEQDFASCNLVEVAHLQKSHMCNNTFHCCITAWRLLTAVAWRREIPHIEHFGVCLTERKRWGQPSFPHIAAFVEPHWECHQIIVTLWCSLCLLTWIKTDSTVHDLGLIPYIFSSGKSISTIPRNTFAGLYYIFQMYSFLAVCFTVYVSL